MLGCFGRRKKKNKDDKKGKNSAPEQRTADNDRNREPAAGNAVGGKLVTPQIRVESHDQPQGDNSATEAPAEVTETITVTRSQSMHNAPPKPGNIKKAATMSRYDFLRKQDNVNYADRWASLKKRYLAAKTENGDVVSKDDVPELRSANNGAPKSPRRSAVQSLPRQFSPTSSGPPSPVKFSDWFYDRQVKEAEARQEFHEREERMRKIIDGPSNEDLEEAAVRIQAGYKGYRTRKEIKAKQESHEEASPGVDEAAAAEKPQDEEPQEQPAGEAQQDGNPEEEIDLNDPELAQAAIKIQAGFKGYQTRKKLKDEADQPEEQQDEAKEHKDAEEEQQPAAAEEEKADEAKPEAAEADADAEAVDPNDPAQNQAASKIQAGFRGMQARKEVAEMRETHQQEDDSAEANDEEAEPAAANEGEAAPEPEAEDKAEAEAEAEPEAEAKAEAEAEAEPEAEAKSEAEAEGKAEAEAEAEPEAEGKAEAEAEGKAESEAEDKAEAEAEAEPEAEATPEAEAKPEAEAEGEPEAEPEADPEAPPAESAAAAAPGGEEENEAAAPAAADDAAGAEGDGPRDE